jgi:hypothetical protein
MTGIADLEETAVGKLDSLRQGFAPAVASVQQVLGFVGVSEPALLAKMGVKAEEFARKEDGIVDGAAPA